MKKFFIIVLSIVCITFLTLFFSGCTNNDNNSNNDNQILNIYNTYVAYAEENGETPLSYEQWLESIKGEKGDKGETGATGQNGQDGTPPTIEIIDGYWYINGENTGVKAEGVDGANGANGQDGSNGQDGVTPTIEIIDGYWYINGENTGVKAEGVDGANGSNGKDESGFFSQYVDVRDFGAQGNGVNDDTAAIRAARDEAHLKGKILYFSEGTYLLSGSIQLYSNMHLIGNNATLIKKAAITQPITADVSAGDTVISVEDASKYKVGEDCYIGLKDTSNYGDTSAKITAIDTINNTITIASYNRHFKNGVARDVKVSSGGVFSSTFSMLCTFRGDDPGSDIIIEGITLDGNRQSNEPYSYQLSTIHIDPAGYNIRIKDCNVKRANADAISVQSNGNVIVDGCIIESAKQNGIHVGFTVDSVSITNNQVYNCYNGFYDCYSVESLSIVGNTFNNCEYGCNGFDEESNGTVISGNNFIGCRYGVKTGAVAGMTITGNSFTGTKYFHMGIYVYQSGMATITGNTFNSLAHAIYIKSGTGVVFNSNVIRNCTTPILVDENNNQNATKTTLCTFTNNMIYCTNNGKNASIIVKFGDN